MKAHLGIVIAARLLVPPAWNCKYAFTFPDGTAGSWEVDRYIVSPDTQEVRSVTASEFSTAW